MNKCLAITLSTLLILAFGCKREACVTVNPMLATVPSDAVAVVTGDCLSSVLASIPDSTHILRKLSYGTLLNNKAALSFCYTSKLTPVITIDAADKEMTFSEASAQLTDMAKLNNLSFKHINGTLALSQSETLTASVERHLKESSSIQDAPHFNEILNLSEGGYNCIFLKNAGALRWLPGNAMNSMFSNREAAAFIKNIARWMVILPTEDDNREIRICGADSPACYSRVLLSGRKNLLKIQEIAPENADFIISESVEDEQFRALYEEFLDANVKLDSYRKKLDATSDSCGKSPLDAEKEMGVKEVALMRWEGRKVTLLRCSSSIKDTLITENAYPGIIPALYGNAFASDDSWTCRRGSWRAFGNKDDVEAFAILPPIENAPKANSFYFRNGGLTIFRDNRGLILWK